MVAFLNPHYSSGPSNSPRYGYTAFCSPPRPRMGVWAISAFWPLCIILGWTRVHRFLCEHASWRYMYMWNCWVIWKFCDTFWGTAKLSTPCRTPAVCRRNLVHLPTPACLPGTRSHPRGARGLSRRGSDLQFLTSNDTGHLPVCFVAPGVTSFREGLKATGPFQRGRRIFPAYDLCVGPGETSLTRRAVCTSALPS